jgi:hypothetical protein
VNFNRGFLDLTEDKREEPFLEKHKAEIDSIVKSGKTAMLPKE